MRATGTYGESCSLPLHRRVLDRHAPRVGLELHHEVERRLLGDSRCRIASSRYVSVSVDGSGLRSRLTSARRCTSPRAAPNRYGVVLQYGMSRWQVGFVRDAAAMRARLGVGEEVQRPGGSRRLRSPAAAPGTPACCATIITGWLLSTKSCAVDPGVRFAACDVEHLDRHAASVASSSVWSTWRWRTGSTPVGARRREQADPVLGGQVVEHRELGVDARRRARLVEALPRRRSGAASPWPP